MSICVDTQMPNDAHPHVYAHVGVTFPFRCLYVKTILIIYLYIYIIITWSLKMESQMCQQVFICLFCKYMLNTTRGE